ncbi:rac guanine nucleotide exchange factor JJ isoform X1 [Nilaparvata lugens]|uniref:rac guanine nucleotide exchange factor JJ isoform X1 n=1 Tax=Nilaparvata lugens TaxID=108931 RepID=UPI00193CC28A|nr:rac guanine nucleotide exchange factor JJ isoform X1 [Nilaparvata lugens]
MSYSELNSPERTLSDELKELIDNRNILTEKTKHKVINDLQREKIEKEEKRLNMQMKTMNELVESERKYLCQLETLLRFFRTPLEDTIKNTAASKVFENIETIRNLNKVLLQRISTDLTPNKIAEAFIELAPFFKLYTNYTNDYKRTILAIQEVRRQNQRIDDNVARQESRPEVANRINSLLIVPVQRVPRYRLLLRELAEHTLAESNEKTLVEHALRRIEEVTEYINSQVNQQDNVQRLLQIQMSLADGKPSIILPGRTLIKEGVLMKVADNEDKGNHAILC